MCKFVCFFFLIIFCCYCYYYFLFRRKISANDMEIAPHPSSSLNVMHNDLRGNYLMLSFKLSLSLPHSPTQSGSPGSLAYARNIYNIFILLDLIFWYAHILRHLYIIHFHSWFMNALKDLVLKIKFGFDHFVRARTHISNIEHCCSIQTLHKFTIFRPAWISSIRFIQSAPE